MSNILNNAFKIASLALISNLAQAQNISFGEANQGMGQLDVSGWLRANIQDKSYSDQEHKLKFDAAKLELKYSRQKFEGELEYRCYQFDKLCDFSSLVNANLSYTPSPDHQFKLGIQDIPFGPGRNWSSNWYGGVLVNTGLEDIHNLGLNYHFAVDQDTQFELGYFARDAGRYTGKSLDSARYSANYVQSDREYSHLNEKNMWLTRLQHQFSNLGTEALNLNLGGSYWYSDIENKTFHSTGHRHSWALFSQIDYQALKFSLTAGRTDIDNKDPIHPHSAMMGSFDSSYAVANKGSFYTADLIYTFGLFNSSSLSPYLTYSRLNKSEKGYVDSSRYIIGTQWNYKDISLVGEYIVGKNDLFIGGTDSAFAAGNSSGSESMLNLLFLYNF